MFQPILRIFTQEQAVTNSGGCSFKLWRAPTVQVLKNEY